MKDKQIILKKHTHFLTYLCVLCIAFFAPIQLNAQVGINNTDPKASLDISASNPSVPTITDGLLVPRVSNFPSPAPTADQNGMLIFLTTTVGLNTPGFYYWNQATTSWLKVMDENAVVTQNWDRTGTTLSPETVGDDLSFANNEHITLENAFSTPDAFINMYLNSSGSNVERTLFTEHIGSIFDLNYHPANNSFLFKSGSTNKVIIDLDAIVPLDVLGSISLGNIGNKYTLPNNNGNASQYLQTDGTGAASWVDLPVTANHDWYEEGTTTAPDNINDNIFTQGNVAIGKNTADYPLDIQTSENIAINVSLYGTDNNFKYGSYKVLTNSGLGTHYGSYNLLLGIGNGADYGTANRLEGSGSGDKVGNYNFITPSSGGTHYGIYSSALKTGSFAGYFLGNVSIGTTAANNYILPASRGTANQIMQTDGTGAASWVDLPVTANHDWYEEGTTTAPDNINDNIFTQGNVAIGKNTADYPLDIQTSENIAINVSLYGTDNNFKYGSYKVLTNSGLGTHYGSYNLLLGIGNGADYGTANRLEGSGSGDKVGNYNFITPSSGGTHYGIYSSALKTGSFAGYFLGNVSIGTTAANNYILPASRGTTNQIMQTDGSGNVSWVNSPLNANWTLSGNAGTNASTNFIGTTDNVNLAIRTNNVERIVIKTNGETEIKNELIINNIATATENATILNDDNYSHLLDNNIDFGTGGNDFTIATQQGVSESAGLHGDGNFNVLWSPGDSSRQLRILDEDNWNDNDGNPYNNAAEVAYIDNAGQYFQASDRNRKQNIKKLENALSKIEQINGYTYQYKINEEERQKRQKLKTTSGIIAQELHEILPEAVEKTEYGEYFVHYAGVMPLLIEGIKDLKKENDQLKEKQKILEERLAKIEALLFKN